MRKWPRLVRREFAFVVVLAVLYTVLSFAYSFIGFLSYEPNSHFHEYSPTRLLVEIGGHLLFGFVAALPFLDLRITALTSAMAILVDVDHILSALDFNTSGRPDHSIMYVIVSTLFIVYFSEKLGLSKAVRWKLAFVATVALLSHISYDIYASAGTSFQLLIPFSFQSTGFGFASWPYFEVAAFLVAVSALLVVRQLTRNEKGPI